MGYSNWRQDLTEVMTDKEDDKKVTEKNIKNKIVINPKLGEAVEALGGELLEMVEMVKPEQEQSPQEKEKEDPKQKKISQVKKQVLMKKMQAVRQGAGSDIVAHYEPEGEQIDEKKGCNGTSKGEECPVHGTSECGPKFKGGDGGKMGPDKNYVKPMGEAVQVPRKTGQIIRVFLTFRGKMYVIQMFFPSVVKPSRAEVQAQIEKVYPGGKVRNYDISDYEPGQPLLHTEDWQKKSGKNPEGGLNEKGRKSYERENPGSDLKRPSKKVGNPRRKSFCARMKGMKKKLTSSKTANDPDSRINKSLRAWNC